MQSDDIVQPLRYYGVDRYRDWMDKAADEIERLRVELAALKADLAQRTAERDEARLEVCELKGTLRWNHYFPHFDPNDYAEHRGWDCYKKAK